MLFFAVHVVSHTVTRGPNKGEQVRGIFDDSVFMELADRGDCPVFQLMAVAAETGNKLSNSEKWLKMRCHTERPVNIDLLLESGFLEPFPETCTNMYEVVPNNNRSTRERGGSSSLHDKLASERGIPSRESKPRRLSWRR